MLPTGKTFSPKSHTHESDGFWVPKIQSIEGEHADMNPISSKESEQNFGRGGPEEQNFGRGGPQKALPRHLCESMSSNLKPQNVDRSGSADSSISASEVAAKVKLRNMQCSVSLFSGERSANDDTFCSTTMMEQKKIQQRKQIMGDSDDITFGAPSSSSCAHQNENSLNLFQSSLHGGEENVYEDRSSKNLKSASCPRNKRREHLNTEIKFSDGPERTDRYNGETYTSESVQQFMFNPESRHDAYSEYGPSDRHQPHCDTFVDERQASQGNYPYDGYNFSHQDSNVGASRQAQCSRNARESTYFHENQAGPESQHIYNQDSYYTRGDTSSEDPVTIVVRGWIESSGSRSEFDRRMVDFDRDLDRYAHFSREGQMSLVHPNDVAEMISLYRFAKNDSDANTDSERLFDYVSGNPQAPAEKEGLRKLLWEAVDKIDAEQHRGYPYGRIYH